MVIKLPGLDDLFWGAYPSLLFVIQEQIRCQKLEEKRGIIMPLHCCFSNRLWNASFLESWGSFALGELAHTFHINKANKTPSDFCFVLFYGFQQVTGEDIELLWMSHNDLDPGSALVSKSLVLLNRCKLFEAAHSEKSASDFPHVSFMGTFPNFGCRGCRG